MWSSIGFLFRCRVILHHFALSLLLRGSTTAVSFCLPFSMIMLLMLILGERKNTPVHVVIESMAKIVIPKV